MSALLPGDHIHSVAPSSTYKQSELDKEEQQFRAMTRQDRKREKRIKDLKAGGYNG